MNEIFADILADTQTPYPVIFARLFGAVLLGAMIGVEREKRQRPAGLRTHILVSLASAIFAVVAIESVHMKSLSGPEVRIDPIRVVEAVTAGVAFLAAGMIVFSKGEVKGLTTGAGMWLAGAVGLSVGFGFWLIAAFAAVASLVVLFVLGRLEVALQWKAPDEFYNTGSTSQKNEDAGEDRPRDRDDIRER
ncbi:MgtC/SapB family protein [Sinorhizobium meliloti]|jgi:putative Mg2+ transporter-C (MgtC) family protein|uniref:Protein MgtC n=5 Tax=Rhizobium meliloti TaxID=382 RepID=Q92RU7_RHIME|nr:MgtC/SapB family protein [Sinorhizobium meliloti]PST29142.1 MgtC/SapB family protein [Mesorhizobium loti]TWA94223.1 putative Mg2+ transporter-C (MgtC) family protein [Ensifer sp. SEMIA 134]TWB28200.1 putative Mg2+ transporter-C (MgtC) family protein [Ensifer sp. SEMIA 135]AEG03298.1 MgtC/SapB transporter [Sinorhizobium meliloti BL225C]AEG52212.1 MgtC/SapB transporter [Sinorhizobium meliloti AK83]